MLSLRYQSKRRINREMPQIYYSQFKSRIESRVNSPFGIFIILIILLLLLGVANFKCVAVFDFFSLKTTSAATILEQRISNLVTTFSITLVLIGWSTTNLAAKESIPFELLFKSAKVYVIFYYLVSLIITLFIISWLKEVSWVNLPNLMVVITLFSILPFVGVVYSFLQFRKVVTSDFLTSMLADEAIEELKKSKMNIVLSKASKVELERLFKNLVPIASNDIHGNKLIKVIINPVDLSNNEIVDEDEDVIIQCLGPQDTTNVVLHDIYTFWLKICIKFFPPHSYQQVQLETKISDNHIVLYLNNSKFPKLKSLLYRLAYCVRPAKDQNPDIKHLDYLNKYLRKSSKDGNTEQVNHALKALEKIQEVNDKILNYTS